MKSQILNQKKLDTGVAIGLVRYPNGNYRWIYQAFGKTIPFPRSRFHSLKAFEKFIRACLRKGEVIQP